MNDMIKRTCIIAAVISLTLINYINAALTYETANDKDKIISSFNNNPHEIVIDKNFSYYDLCKNAALYEDKSGNLTIDEIASEKYPSKFFYSERRNLGLTASAYWLRFDIRNSLESPAELNLEIKYPMLDIVELYVPDNEGFSKRVRSQDACFRNFVFTIKQATETQTYYVRVKTSGSMKLSASLWSPPAFIKEININNSLLSAFYGIIIALLLYNLFIFFSLKDASYLYYIGFILFSALQLSIIDGFAAQYKWPGPIHLMLPVFINLSLACALQFTRSFLNVRTVSRFMDRTAVLFIILSFALITAAFAMTYTVNIICSVALALSTVLIVVVCGIMSINKKKSAKYFLAAWAVLIAGITLFSLSTLGFIEDIFITGWGMHIGLGVEMILLSFALADRINIMKNDMHDLNIHLEEIVTERTKDLNYTLDEIQKKDELLQKELTLAANIQSGLLPEMPMRHNGLNIFSYYRSQGKIGGDFYDVFMTQDDCLGIIIADASGHGIPAAFVSSMAKISFLEASQKYSQPKEIISYVNRALIKVLKCEEYLTAFLMIICPNYEIMYTNASHQRPIIIRAKTRTLEILDTNGLFVGAVLQAEDSYESKKTHLEYGDRIFLYTDGLEEAQNMSGVAFDEERIHEILLRTIDIPLEQAKNEIIKFWENYVSGNYVRDDVSFILLELDTRHEKFLLYMNKGIEYMNSKKRQRAIEEFNKAVEIDPMEDKIYLHLGRCYFAEGDFVQAVKNLEIYMQKNTGDAGAAFMLAESYYNAGLYELAIRQAEKLLLMTPDNNEILRIIGLALKKLGKVDESNKIWDKYKSIK